MSFPQTWNTSFPSLSPVILAQLEEPSELLTEPEPRSRRGQQVVRLRQLGLYKAADAVTTCGQLGEKATFECGRQYLRRIIRSHRRFCCKWCDSFVSERLFRDHSAYAERLSPSGVLHQLTVRSDRYDVTPEGVRDFENTVAKSIRSWLVDQSNSGFKFFTHFENNSLVAKAIVYLPPGSELPPHILEVPKSTATLGPKTSTHAFNNMLSGILQPTSTGDGIVRADLMAAFQGGNHLRSAGVFYGLISKKRQEGQSSKEDKDLCLIGGNESGTSSVPPIPRSQPDVTTCPHCGPNCKLTSISFALTLDVIHLPPLTDANGAGMARDSLHLRTRASTASRPMWHGIE